jgi:hypothetical protein
VKIHRRTGDRPYYRPCFKGVKDGSSNVPAISSVAVAEPSASVWILHSTSPNSSCQFTKKTCVSTPGYFNQRFTSLDAPNVFSQLLNFEGVWENLVRSMFLLWWSLWLKRRCESASLTSREPEACSELSLSLQPGQLPGQGFSTKLAP